MKAQYQAIGGAGFVLQLDCPDLALSRHIMDVDSEIVRPKLQALTEGPSSLWNCGDDSSLAPARGF
jgi:hypothetical protein